MISTRKFFIPVDYSQFTNEIVAISLDILNIACYSLMTLIFKRVLFLRIANPKTPWSSPNFRDQQMRYLEKVIIVIF